MLGGMGGGCPGAAADSGGPQVPPTCACPGLAWAQDRLCKASEQNKLTVPWERGPACLPPGVAGGRGWGRCCDLGWRGGRPGAELAALWGTWARRRVP